MTEHIVESRARAAIQSVEKMEAPVVQNYYANSVDILMSFYDFVLTLGQMRAASLEKVVVEQQARVIMSPQHAKTLVRVLGENVARYEATFGPIPERPIEPSQPSEQSPDAAPN